MRTARSVCPGICRQACRSSRSGWLPARRAGGIIASLSLPMMMPALIIGVSLICFFVRFLDLRLNLLTVTLSQLVIAQPFVILIVETREHKESRKRR